jgi:hypothetical protein
MDAEEKTLAGLNRAHFLGHSTQRLLEKLSGLGGYIFFWANRRVIRSSAWKTIAAISITTRRSDTAFLGSRRHALGLAEGLVSFIRATIRSGCAYGITFVSINSGHLNALLFRSSDRVIYWFEPHGYDVQNRANKGRDVIRHTHTGFNRELRGRIIPDVKRALSEVKEAGAVTFKLPADYMPAVWGQSVTGDQVCGLHCLAFALNPSDVTRFVSETAGRLKKGSSETVIEHVRENVVERLSQLKKRYMSSHCGAPALIEEKKRRRLSIHALPWQKNKRKYG